MGTECSYKKLFDIFEGRDRMYWRSHPVNANDLLPSLIKYINGKYTGLTNLNFVKTYLGVPVDQPIEVAICSIPPISWQQFGTACMMCIFEKSIFKVSEFDPTTQLYPGANNEIETKNLRIWNLLNEFRKENLFRDRDIALILYRLMIIKNEYRPLMLSRARYHRPMLDLNLDPIIINLYENRLNVIPTNLSEFNIFINSKYIEFNYSKLYLKLCIEHMAKQKMSRIIRLITSNPDYKLARKRIMDVYHS